ncbi:MAG TPA: PDDEXK nuclease domain-containing protein [Ktedonobacterales bacterium]|jgi:predicted nuclease of restriction endonuclease-like (RecB) superfamily
MANVLIPAGYEQLLGELKGRIRTAQLRAALSVNRELVLLYWQIGREILQRQEEEGWGAKVIDRLSRDLWAEFPEMKGFSSHNLKYMRAFARAYTDESIVQAALAQITWYHNITLLDKVKDPTEREWYMHATVRYGWSRDILAHQIDSALYQRQGQAVTNFDATLPAPQSDLARQLLKDPYNFDFLSLGAEAHERDLERGLLTHLRDFLLELGVGFAFLGSQYHLEVGGEDFYLDLLFYHVRLRCYVVIDLKMGKFEPEYAGKMNFYLAAADDLLRHGDDQPSIGIILCRTRNRLIAEYALRDIHAPLGVATYRLSDALPADLRGSLPTIDELEGTLASLPGEDQDASDE